MRHNGTPEHVCRGLLRLLHTVDTLPLPLLIFLIVVAVVVGFWVGGRANREVESRRREGKTLGARVRDGAGKAALSFFRWNRKRKRDRERDGS